MSSEPIPVVEVQGTHRQVGQQIGETMREPIRRTLEHLHDWLPGGVTWATIQHKGQLYLAHSQAVYPQSGRVRFHCPSFRVIDIPITGKP